MNRLQDAERTINRSPNNPYAQGARATFSVGGDPGMPPGQSLRHHDGAARGLDAPMLDAMLKDRMSEGIMHGHQRGSDEAQRRYADIFDEGYDQGARAGFADGYRKREQELVPTLKMLRRELAALSRLTRGSVMRDRLGALEDEISYTLGDKLRPAPEPAP